MLGLIFGLGVVASVSYNHHRVERFNVSSPRELALLQQFVNTNDVDPWSQVSKGLVDIRLSPGQQVPEGLVHEVLIDNVQSLIEGENLIGYSSDFIASYHSVSEIYSWLDTIDPNATFIAGRSYEERPIKGIRIGPDSAKYKVVAHGGSTLANGSPQQLSSTSSTPSKLSNSTSSSISFLSPTQTATRGNPCGHTYSGAYPFSSLETKSIAEYLLKVRPIAYFDFHAYGQLFMSPYGYSCQMVNKHFASHNALSKWVVAAIQSTSGRVYRHGPICTTIYQAFGSSVDWAYEYAGIKYPYAVELPDLGNHGFLLPPSYINSIGEEFLAGLEAAAQYIMETE
ncbi:corticosteroid- binding protein [Massospora cicadina]|nr:corticosteroid- binding protein [Massospora cicadina]